MIAVLQGNGGFRGLVTRARPAPQTQSRAVDAYAPFSIDIFVGAAW